MPDDVVAASGALRCCATHEDPRWIVDTWTTRWGTEQVVTLARGHDLDDDLPTGWAVAVTDAPAASPDLRLREAVRQSHHLTP